MAKWEKGESGNPHGRPAHPMAERFREAVEPRLPVIITAMADAAANGDAQAAKLLLDRVVPPMKPIPRAEPFPLIGGTLTERAESILSAVSDGALAPADGKGLIDALTSLARLIELDEIERRLKALEERAV